MTGQQNFPKPPLIWALSTLQDFGKIAGRLSNLAWTDPNCNQSNKKSSIVPNLVNRHSMSFLHKNLLQSGFSLKPEGETSDTVYWFWRNSVRLEYKTGWKGSLIDCSTPFLLRWESSALLRILLQVTCCGAFFFVEKIISFTQNKTTVKKKQQQQKS